MCYVQQAALPEETVAMGGAPPCTTPMTQTWLRPGGHNQRLAATKCHYARPGRYVARTRQATTPADSAVYPIPHPSLSMAWAPRALALELPSMRASGLGAYPRISVALVRSVGSLWDCLAPVAVGVRCSGA